MRWLEHAAVGVVVALLFVIIGRGLNAETLVVCSAAAILGSVLPDIDHPMSKIRKLFRFVLFLVLLIVIFLLLTTPSASAFVGKDIFIVFIASILLSALFVFVADMFIPPHRGPLHSVGAAAVYGIASGLLAIKIGSAVAIGAAAALGYISHIIVDALTTDTR